MIWGMSTAYAAEHTYTQEGGTISGLEGTDKTHSMNDNKITLGKEGGPTDKPQNLQGAISAGGKKGNAADVTGNTLIIHGLRSANGNGFSFIYGGVSGTGAVTGNKVIFNNGYSADAVIGGYSASLTKSVSNNTVEVKAGKIEEDIIGGWSDKAASTGAVSGNKVTITGGTLGSYGAGIIYGARVTGNGSVTGNSVEFSNATSKKAVYGAAGDDAASTAAIKENHVTINSGTLSSDVFGGYTTGKGAVTGNSVTIKGGSLGDEAAGGVIGNSASSANASGNTLTISGGAFTKSGGTNVYGGYTAGSGKTINNTVNLGDGENAMALGFDLTRVKIYGGNKINDVTGNTLNVNASGIVVRTAQNFEKYNFNLTKGVAAGSTMLKMTDSGGFGSTPNVQWSKITMNAAGWNADTTKYGRLGTMELLRTGGGADLKIFNTAALDRKATSGDFEYHMYTDVTTPPMSFFGYNMVNYVRADIDRFQNADATADNVAGTEVYGGYSSLGNTTTNNKIKITNTNNTNLNVYGGYTVGAGDSTNNHVTITATGKVKAAYGGYATAANSKAEGNSVTVESDASLNDSIYGGWAKKTANNNTVRIAGGTFRKNIYGGYATAANGTTENNTVNLGDDTHTDLSGATLTASDIYGGNKAATGNTLNVNAKNIAAKSVNKFENYKFKLNESFGNGDTMLSVTSAGDFGGTGVDWGKISVDRSGLSADYVSNVHGVHRVTLLKSATANALNFSNYDATIYAATDTHESAVQTDTDSGTATSVFMEINRFKNGRVTYDGTGETYAKTWGNEIYGGLSHDGHTTTGNQLTVKALRGVGDPSHVFGGKNEGTTGDVTQNTVDIELAHDDDTIAEVYGGQANNVDGAGKVDGNIANMKKGTVNLLYAGYTFDDGAVTNNTVNFLGGTSTGYIGGGYIDKATSTAEVSYNKVLFTDGTAGQIRGGVTIGSGAAKKNAVEFSAGTAMGIRGAEIEGGTAEENEVAVKGGTVSGDVYGAETSGTGEAKNNTVTISGGTVNAEVAGGVGYKATENTVTLTGGTVSGDVYGGKSAGPGSSTSGNIVNLGAENGTYTANLTNAALHGDNNSGTGATLNVRAKDITAKSADKFENYKFHLNDDIATNGGSMLTLTENNGFNGGNLFDWTKLDVDTSKLSGSTVIGKATLLTGTANGLKFSNYAGRNKTTAATNGDYETALRTDTNAATATKVILDYNRFQNNANAMYDGSIPPTQLADGSTEVYGGISYTGNTTKNNHLTITNLQADLDFAYGGKTAALTGNTENNSVTVTGTGNKKIDNINGGYTGATNGTASANRVLIKGGTVTNVMGGAVSGANGSATDNEVIVEGGTVTNVIGGGGSTTAAGNMANNRVTITDGTVTGQIVGGDSRVLTSTSNNNTITLGGGTLTGSQVWGTSYGGTVLANTDAKIAGNTLNVEAKDGVTLKKVRNVEKFNFQLVDDTTKTAPLLNLTELGGFGKVTADNSDVKMKWSNVTADMSKVTTEADAAKIQGKNTYILMRAADPTLKFSDYAARYDTYGGVYETGLRTNTNSDTAQEVLYDVNRFKDGRVTYTTTSTGEALGGYSAFGSTTEGNELTLTGVTGTLAAAYGGQTAGVTGDSANNKVTLKGTGTGSIVNVYGGAITKAANSGNATGNTVTLTGGTVTGAVYGGYTEGSGKTTGNTVNIGDGTAATLAAGTNLANAMLAGGNKSEMTGNTLNVMVKDAAAKKAQNFENYTFHLTDHIAADKPKSGVVDDAFTKSRGTMLTLAEGFDGQTADWSKVTVDTSKLSADKTLGAITLMKSAAANKLKFSNYAAKNHAVSGDYEVVQRTDTNTGVANAVLIDVNRFRNGDVTYHNGDNNAKTYAGVSYGGNTAEGNKFTLKGISEGKTLQYVSGGRSEGTAGGAVKNTVNLLSTGKGTLEEVYGGYVGSVANAADVTENTVNIAGGTAKNVYGGYTRGTGKTVKNTVNIGYTDEAGVFHDVADGAKITGTIYGGSGSDATGNVLNVSGKIAAGNIKNFESVKFHVRNTMASGTTLLTLDGAAATEGLDWTNVTLDEFKPAVKSYEAYRLTLMANEKGIDFRKGGVDTYAPIGAKGVIKGDYEAALDTDTHAAQAKAVNAEIYRFHGNTATYGEADGAHDAAWGGRSVLGNDATDNALTISGGTLKDAYGGWSTGKKADGTSGKTTGNTVNFTGGTVTGTIYGGNNGAAGNTLNVTGIQSAGDIKNFEKLHFDTSMAKAGDTILTLNGGKKTTGLDWQKVEAAGLDEASLATRTGVAREELFSLMANDKGIDFGTSYDKAKEKTVGDYEYAIAKEADAAKGAAAEKVVVRGFRFQNNADSVYETGDNKAAWGGRSIIGNTVQRNKLTVKGGTLTEAAYGGLSAKGAVTDNTLVLAGGTLKNAYGGFVEGAGDATKNTVEVQKDTQAQIYGGYAAQGEASGNILNLGAVNIGANVYGGSGKKTDGNVINLFGTKIKGTVTGGTVTGGTAADGKANVLAIRAAGTEIGDFKGIQNLKFYLPEGAKSSMATMLRLGVKDKDIKGLNVDLNLSGAAKTLKREDVFSLMKVAEGGTLTTDEKIKGEVTGTQGVSLDYKFRVQKKGTDELIAAVESVKMKDETKSLAETRTTATDVLGGGMTMLADAGVSAAVQAAASANANAQVEAAPMATNKAPSAKAASAANVQSGAYTAWAAQGGSSMRIHSGSYVDTHGYTLNVGFARKQDGKDSTLTFGPFVEYGRASYDSYLEDAAGTHGSGKVSYIGAGVLARQDLKSGLYLEGSVRGGRIKSDYEGNISGTSTSYDISNPYYAIHLGVGKETKLKAGDALETYLKYFFSHQNGTSGKLSTGEDYDFDAVNSHRLRLGARYTHDMGEEGRFYAGLAWEYEFNGEARATYQGMATPSPSLKGGSAMLELGYRFTPKKSRVSYDVNFSGWQGKREGFSGSVGVNWAF